MVRAVATHQPYKGAFIVPTATIKGEKYLFLGIEKIKNMVTKATSWEASAFGGKREFYSNGKPKETLQECARREFQQESLGIIGKDSSIKKRLADQNKYHVNKVDLKNTTTFYFVPVKVKGDPVAKFAKKRQSPNLSRSQKEMKEVIAVKFSEVLRQNALNPHNMTFGGYRARAITAIAFKEGIRQGFIH